VFAEQLLEFVRLWGDLRDEFVRHHADLLPADHWRNLQTCHLVPYTWRRAALSLPARSAAPPKTRSDSYWQRFRHAVCQPGPVALQRARVSGGRRREIDVRAFRTWAGPVA